MKTTIVYFGLEQPKGTTERSMRYMGSIEIGRATQSQWEAAVRDTAPRYLARGWTTRSMNFKGKRLVTVVGLA